MAKKTSTKNNDIAPTSAATPTYDLRSQAGRAEYDAAVAKALKKTGADGIDGPTLSTKVGGTLPQLRASLARLIDGGQAKKTGSTRATRYLAA